MASRWGVVLFVLACAPRARAPSPPRDLGGFSLPRACSRAPAAAWVPRKGASWQAAPQQLRHGELALRGGGAGGARAGGEADGQSETESMPALQEIIYVAPKRKWQRYSSARARAAPGTHRPRVRAWDTIVLTRGAVPSAACICVTTACRAARASYRSSRTKAPRQRMCVSDLLAYLRISTSEGLDNNRCAPRCACLAEPSLPVLTPVLLRACSSSRADRCPRPPMRRVARTCSLPRLALPAAAQHRVVRCPQW